MSEDQDVLQAPLSTKQQSPESGGVEILKPEEDVCAKEKEALALENKDLQEQVLRLSADLQNIRRRSDSEKVKARFDGSASVVLSIAKIIDDLDRAFSHLPDDLANHSFIVSLQAIEKNLQSVLTSQNIDFIGNQGDVFDEKYHESLLTDPSANENTIAQVFEKGITLKGEVIRHAKVSVGTKSIILTDHEKNS